MVELFQCKQGDILKIKYISGDINEIYRLAEVGIKKDIIITVLQAGPNFIIKDWSIGNTICIRNEKIKIVGIKEKIKENE